MIANFKMISNDVHKSVYTNLKLSGQNIANEIKIMQTGVEATVCALAHSVTVSKQIIDKALVKRVLQNNRYPSIVSGGIWLENRNEALFFVKDLNGTLYYDDSYAKEASQDYRNASWYAPVRKLKEDTVRYSDVYIDPYTHEEMITISAPIYRDAVFEGVTTIDIATKNIDTIAQTYAQKIGGYVLMLDQSNTIIANSATDHYKHLNDLANQKPSFYDFNSQLQNGAHFIFDNDPFLHVKSYGTVFISPQTQWKLVLITPYDKAFYLLETIINTVANTSIIAVLILAFLGYYGLKYLIIRPINTISRQLHNDHHKAIALLSPVQTDQKGEIGEMVDILNERTEALKERHHEVLELQAEIEATQKEVVFTMGAIGESRSKETGNHVKRVAEYSKILALYYGLDEAEAEMLKQASPMHDIGKVAIPDAILNKPGRFDKEERKIMDTHAELGHQMLRYSERPLLKCAATVAYEHHEKYDGTGYPQKLKGESIHIYGRITALADVFDALGSDRCYKKAWEDDKIFTLFKEERGKHFDPKLVDIFFEHLDEFLTVRETLKDRYDAF